MNRAWASASVALALALASSACKSKAAVDPEAKNEAHVVHKDAAPKARARQTLVLRQIRFEDLSAAATNKIDGELATTLLRDALLASPLFARSAELVAPDRQVTRVEIDLRVNRDLSPGDSEGSLRLLMTVELETHFVDGSSERAPHVQHFSERQLAHPEAAEQDALLAASLREDIRLASDDYLAQEELRQASDVQLVARLRDGIEDPELLSWALQLAGDRRLTGAFDAAVDALQQKDKNVVDSAMTALVSIGNPDAIEALSADVDFTDHERLLVLMEAISALGGPDAEAFLEFVASGHPDDVIRGQARARLGRLKAAAKNEVPANGGQ